MELNGKKKFKSYSTELCSKEATTHSITSLKIYGEIIILDYITIEFVYKSLVTWTWNLFFNDKVQVRFSLLKGIECDQLDVFKKRSSAKENVSCIHIF